MKRALIVLVLALSLAACNRNTYTVIERTNDSEYSVRVVLLHDGTKFHATCNNIKATADPNINEHCNLHVGQTVKCQFFSDRLSLDAGGYDLICGDDRRNGKLITSGKNELLQVDKEDQ
jgi:hypothetical protein